MPSLTTYRQQLAIALKGYPQQEMAGLDSSTRIYSGTATSGSTTALLEDTAWPHLSSIAKDDTLEGAVLFRPDAAATADKVRQVTAGGYAPSTGKSTVDKAWGTAAYAGGVGEKYEYHTHGFDPLVQMQDILNEALKRIYVPVDVVFTPRSGSYTQDVTSGFSWLLYPWQIINVRSLPEAGTQQQTITEAGSPGGGTFTITYRGSTTGAMNYNDTAATVQTALRLLPYLGAVTVTRTGTSTNFVWTITMQDVIGPTVLFTTTSSLTGGSSPTLTVAQSRAQLTMTDQRGKAQRVSDVLEIKLYSQFNSGTITLDRLYMRVWKPAYQHCRASSTGVFGDRAGLAAEAHQAMPEYEYVVAQALVYAWGRYPETMEGRGASLAAAQYDADAWRASYHKREARTFRDIAAVA